MHYIQQQIHSLINIHWENTVIIIGKGLLKLILIYLLYLIINGIGKRVISSIFLRYEKSTKTSPGRIKTLSELCKNIFSYALIFILLVTVLRILSIDVTGILAGAGIIGLAVGFGAQGLVSDVVTGFFILLEKQIDVDEYITIGTLSGVVEQVGLRTTLLRDFDGTLHYLPNRQITSVSNHSRGNMQALVDLSIGNEFLLNDTLNKLQEKCKMIAFTNKHVVEGPNVLGVQSYTTSDTVVRIIARTENGKQWEVERDITTSVKELLEELQQEKERLQTDTDA